MGTDPKVTASSAAASLATAIVTYLAVRFHFPHELGSTLSGALAGVATGLVAWGSGYVRRAVHWADVYTKTHAWELPPSTQSGPSQPADEPTTEDLP